VRHGESHNLILATIDCTARHLVRLAGFGNGPTASASSSSSPTGRPSESGATLRSRRFAASRRSEPQTAGPAATGWTKAAAIRATTPTWRSRTTAWCTTPWPPNATSPARLYKLIIANFADLADSTTPDLI